MAKSSAGPRGGQRRQGGRAKGRRATSKPLIIDVEASSSPTVSPTVPASDKAQAASPQTTSAAPSAKPPSTAGAPGAAGSSVTGAGSVAADTGASVGKSQDKASAPIVVPGEGDKKAAENASGAAKVSETSGKSAAKPSENGGKPAAAAATGPFDKKASRTQSAPSGKEADGAEHGAASPPTSPSNSPSPPAAALSDAGKANSGPNAFYLFAAALIGGLIAFVLFFLAQLLGLFTLNDGRVDEQQRALVEAEGRLEARIESVEAELAALSEASSGDASTELEAVQASISRLQEQLDTASVPADGSAAPAAELPDVDALISNATRPLGDRLSELETGLTSLAQTISGGDDQAVDMSSMPIPGLADIEAAIGDLDTVVTGIRGDLGMLRDDVSALQEAAPPSTDDGVAVDGAPNASQAADMEALAASVASTIETVSALEETVAGLGLNVKEVSGTTEELTAAVADLAGRLDSAQQELSGLSASLAALTSAPNAPMPDSVARLGVATNLLIATRDGGEPVGSAVAALVGASAEFEGLQSLAANGGEVTDQPLSDPALSALLNSVLPAMLEAARGDDDSGLMGALGDRARQLVSITGPSGADLMGASNSAGIEALGALVSGGAYEAASQAFAGLPEDVQTAGSDLGSALAARVNVDALILAAQATVAGELGVAQ
ncbi:MAG: hypothetical protein AAGH60_05350 [Pseudomonadota bacterium]